MARSKHTANTPFGVRQKEWSCRWKQEYARYSRVLLGIEMEWRRNPPHRDIVEREFKAYVFCNYGNYHYYMQDFNKLKAYHDRNRLKLWYVSGVQELSQERGTFVVFSQLDLNEEILRKDAGIILKNGTSFHQGIKNAALCLADTLDILPHDTVHRYGDRYGASQPSTSGTSRPSTSEHVAQSTPPKDFGKQNVSPHIVGDITSTVFTKLGLPKSPNFWKLMKDADEKNIRPVPYYKLLSSEGPSNNPRFVYTVTFKGKMVQGDKEKTKVKAIENCAGVYCELHEEHLYVPPTEAGDLRDSVKETPSPSPSPLQPGQWLIGSPECPSVRLRSALTEREAPHWNALMRHASKEALDVHMCRWVDGGTGGSKTGFQFKLQCNALSITALIGKKKQKEWEALESVAEVTCERNFPFMLQRNKRKTMVEQTGTEPPTLTVAN